MDFDEDHMKSNGHGQYHPLPVALLPRLWLVYCDNPSDSGKVHSDVKRRWMEGEPGVVEKMRAVAACAEEGRCVMGGVGWVMGWGGFGLVVGARVGGGDVG